MQASHDINISPSRQKPPMNVYEIQWNRKRYTITMREMTIGLTAEEYPLLFSLRHGMPMTHTNIARTVYQCRANEEVRAILEKRITSIRGKLQGSGISVYCIVGYGYLLLPEPQGGP